MPSVAVRVEACGNVSAEIQRVFETLDAPRPVTRLRVQAAEGAVPEAWWVTGWSAATEAPCPARACRVADSGDGVAVLVFGGDGGVRIQRSETTPSAWRLSDRRQEGEPYLVLGVDRVEILE